MQLPDRASSFFCTERIRADTQYAFARMLLARRGRGVAERARDLLAAARRTARDHELIALLARIDELSTAPSAVTTLPDSLTARELTVLQLIAQGRSNRAIGQQLFISEHTAANHVRSILMKRAAQTGPSGLVRPSPPACAPGPPLGHQGEHAMREDTHRLPDVKLQLTTEEVDLLEAADADEDLRCLLPFLRADRLKCYCLHQSSLPRRVFPEIAGSEVAAVERPGLSRPTGLP